MDALHPDPARAALGASALHMDGRREERLSTALAVVFDRGTGVTRNISKSGMYLVTDHPLPVGAPIRLMVEMTNQPTGTVRVRCEAKVLRVEEVGAEWGIAAAIRWNGEE